MFVLLIDWCFLSFVFFFPIANGNAVRASEEFISKIGAKIETKSCMIAGASVGMGVAVVTAVATCNSIEAVAFVEATIASSYEYSGGDSISLTDAM